MVKTSMICFKSFSLIIFLFDFSFDFLLDFSGKECEDSELVSHLMPGTESRTAVTPFACLSNITDQDLFDVDVIKDVCKFCCVTFLYPVYHLREIILLIIILAKSPVKHRHLIHIL